MSPEAMNRVLDALHDEERRDRSYDEQSPGHLLMPNHSFVSSFDRAFLGACAPYVLEAHLIDCGLREAA